MRGVVAAGSPEAAAAGAKILREGGNAVDAAVSAAFASFSAEACVSSIGGGGFALVSKPDEPPQLYDFFCAMPGINGSPEARERMDFVEIPITFGTTLSSYHAGRGSTAVPGNPAGLGQVLETMGTLPLADVLQPAIDLAREPLEVSVAAANILRSLEGVVQYHENSRALFAPGGKPLQPGDHYHNPAFAETLAHFAKHGLQDFYTGEIADAIVRDHSENPGLITQDDLQLYRVIMREPLKIHYRSHTFYTNPPPSSGGILIAFVLQLLEQYDLAPYDYHSTEHVRLLAEVMRQANIARYRDHPRNLVGMWQEWIEDMAADDAQLRARLDAGQFVADAMPGERSGSGSTTHISTMDENGLAVAITMTPGATGGYVVGETGMLMNNILGEGDLNPMGFHQHAPGVRLTSMMSPTVVETEDRRRIALGSAGSSRIRSAVVQVISNLSDWVLPIDNAVNNPRVHYEGGLLDLELGYVPDTADALEAMGYDLKRWKIMHLYFGGAHVAMRNTDGSFSGAGDARRGGAYVVVD